jgi:HpiC1 cyclase
MQATRYALAAIALAGIVSAAHAAAISIPDASFDSNAGGYWAATDWSTTQVGPQNAIEEVLSGNLAGKHGTNFLSIGIEGSNGEPANVGYEFSAALGTFQPNTTYTLTVALANMNNWNPTDLQRVGIGLATGDTPASIAGSEIFSLRNDNNVGNYVSYNAFADSVYTLTTGASGGVVGQDIRVVLSFEHAGEYGRSGYFDNVRLDASAVPEPAALALVGSASLLVMRRRRTC